MKFGTYRVLVINVVALVLPSILGASEEQKKQKAASFAASKDLAIVIPPRASSGITDVAEEPKQPQDKSEKLWRDFVKEFQDQEVIDRDAFEDKLTDLSKIVNEDVQYRLKFLKTWLRHMQNNMTKGREDLEAIYNDLRYRIEHVSRGQVRVDFENLLDKLYQACLKAMPVDEPGAADEGGEVD